MVTVTIAGGELHLEVNGLDKLWSLTSTLRIPLAHVRSVAAAPEAARHWFEGLKVAESYIPGVLTSGQFYYGGGHVFWDVHHPGKAIDIALEHERYEHLVVEVADPARTIAEITAALAARPA